MEKDNPKINREMKLKRKRERQRKRERERERERDQLIENNGCLMVQCLVSRQVKTELSKIGQRDMGRGDMSGGWGGCYILVNPAANGLMIIDRKCIC